MRANTYIGFNVRIQPEVKIKLVSSLCKSLRRPKVLQPDVNNFDESMSSSWDIHFWNFEIFNFRYEPEVKVKWGHTLCSICKVLKDLSHDV